MKISLKVKECSEIKKGFGLMFHTKNTPNLLFSFNKYSNASLTAWFVFFPFLVIWLDEKNRVIDYRLVSPFTSTIRTKKRFNKIVELPLNNENKKLIRFFVDKERFK